MENKKEFFLQFAPQNAVKQEKKWSQNYTIPVKKQAYILISAPKKGVVSLADIQQRPIVSANLLESINKFEEQNDVENLIGIIPLSELLLEIATIEEYTIKHNINFKEMISLATDLIVNEKPLPKDKQMAYLLFCAPKGVENLDGKVLKREAIVCNDVKSSLEEYKAKTDKQVVGILSLGQILTQISLLEFYAKQQGYDFSELVEAASELVD